MEELIRVLAERCTWVLRHVAAEEWDSALQEAQAVVDALKQRV